MLDFPDRLFQVYEVSRTRHQLWLRSDRGPGADDPYLIDVHFDSVQLYCGPFAIRGLCVRRATPEEQDRLTERHGLDADASIHLLSRDHDWFVVSGAPQWVEADLSYNAPSPFWASHPDSVIIARGSLTTGARARDE